MQSPHCPGDPAALLGHLTQAESDCSRLFNLSLDLLCIAGLDGYFKQVNPSWTRVLGWSQEELLSRPVAEFMHPDDRERTLQARANLAKGIPVRGLENRYLCKDGSHRWLAWQSSIEPGAQTVFAVARDITEQRRSHHEHLVLGKLESTRILAGGIAHDFNNLLATLLLNLEMISMCGATNDQQEKLLRQSLETVHAARVLTQQFNTFAQSEVSGPRITLDLKMLLQQSLDLALRGSTLRGESRLAPDLWPAEVDEAQIGLVIRNLVLNAKEAMPAGGIVRLQAENLQLGHLPGLELPPGDYLRISVTDEGIGIPAHALPQVFDPYFSTKQRGAQKGMGLGLTICHAVIQKHGGGIIIDSQPGSGTTVQCHLPAAKTAGKKPSSPPWPDPSAQEKFW
jgi:PAS domain S-box-containing protein